MDTMTVNDFTPVQVQLASKVYFVAQAIASNDESTIELAQTCINNFDHCEWLGVPKWKNGKMLRLTKRPTMSFFDMSTQNSNIRTFRKDNPGMQMLWFSSFTGNYRQGFEYTYGQTGDAYYSISMPYDRADSSNCPAYKDHMTGDS